MKLKIIKNIYDFFLNDINITWLVVINCIITFLLSFPNIAYHDELVNFDIGLTVIFAIEMGIKLKVFGKHFFKKSINTFDFLLVAISIIPLLTFSWIGRLDYLLVLRGLRIFKCTRLFRAIPNYEHLLVNLKIAFKASIGVIIGIFIMIFIFSIVLSSLYSNVAPEYFSNPFESIYTVFRLFSIEGWYDIPNDIAANTSPIIGTITKYLISGIVLIGGMFGMSFVNSVFVDEMAVDNNENVLKEINELKKLIKELKENGNKS